jgi:penicillin amidase
MRWLKRLVLVSLAVIIAGGAAGFFWLRTSLPLVDGTLAIPGLEHSVSISRDTNGVPHIKATTQHDAYFALGLAHAQDRLWQMDFQRRLGQGRLSEILGRPTTATDRYMRTLGLYRLAQASLPHLSPKTRESLQAYADGVNAWVETKRHAWWRAWPIEFYLLRYRPEPWQPADSLVWGRTMGLFLSRNWREEVLRAQIIRKLGKGAVKTLIPPYPDGAPRTLAGLMENPLAEGSASNFWVLGGKRTGSGKPLLANDPHLRFRSPGLWYLARVSAPGLDVTGTTVPGMPFTVLGHNREIAWGFTSAESDVQDLYIETLAPGQNGRYIAPGGTRAIETREERIKVRGDEDIVFSARATRHGPVISDLSPDVAALAGKDKIVSLATPSLLPDDRTADALHGLNRATGWQDFREALRNWHSPHVNIAMANRAGNIGMISPARIPVRRWGYGDVPAPGAGELYDWTGFIPFEQLPQSLNPAKGVIVNANNPTVRTVDYRYWLGLNHSPGYRATRIEEILSSRRRHDADAMTRLQMDSTSLMVRDLLPLMTKIHPTSKLGRQALALLKDWDGNMDRGKPQPLVFMAWISALKGAIFADELGELFSSFSGFRTQPIKRALTKDHIWCNNRATKATETCETILIRALETAISELAKKYEREPKDWRWGDAHEARFDHPVLGRIPIIGTLFNVRIPVDGGSYTINRGHMSPDNPKSPFASVHGAGLRAVYDLSDISKSRFAIAPGQSGNPLSSHYDDMAEIWRDGGFVTPGTRTPATQLTLNPAPGAKAN